MTNVQTTATVAATIGDGWIASMVIQIDTEKMAVGAGANSTNLSSITRAYDGSAAATHATGATVTKLSRYTTLSALLTTSGTAPTVASSVVFPQTGGYMIQVDSEIMLVQNGWGTTTWTVVRGYNGTSAALHATGATATMFMPSADCSVTLPSINTPGIASLTTGGYWTGSISTNQQHLLPTSASRYCPWWESDIFGLNLNSTNVTQQGVATTANAAAIGTVDVTGTISGQVTISGVAQNNLQINVLYVNSNKLIYRTFTDSNGNYLIPYLRQGNTLAYQIIFVAPTGSGVNDYTTRVTPTAILNVDLASTGVASTITQLLTLQSGRMTLISGTKFPQKYTQVIGDGSSKTFTITHNLNTREVIVGVRRIASPYDVADVYYEATDLNDVTIYFNTAPTSSQYLVSVFA